MVQIAARTQKKTTAPGPTSAYLFNMTSPLPSFSHPSPLMYGRLRPSQSTGLPDPNPNPLILNKYRALLLVSVVFLVAGFSAMAVAIVKSRRHTGPVELATGSNRAIVLACGQTQYPTLCMESLEKFPGVEAADRKGDLVPVSMKVALGRFREAVTQAAGMGDVDMDSYDQSAYGDCIDLMDDSLDMLNRSLAAVDAASPPAVDGGYASNKVVKGMAADVMTWLSAALTNQDTCTAGLLSASDTIKVQMSAHLQNLTELVSNSLSIYATTYGGGNDDVGDFSGAPTPNRRLLSSSYSHEHVAAGGDYPSWVSRRDRVLLESTPVADIKADVVVSKTGGSGTVKTIGEAIAMAPKLSQRRFVLYIKAGRYEESNLNIGHKQMNLWFIGDGIGKTVITGSKSVDRNKITTFNTATLGVSGDRFIARDITFANEAGPDWHQAVALRVGSDQSVIYRCEIRGYQDTLYTYSKRQFYRECDIYGTVDFIFGNSAVVFQHCTIYSQKPAPKQKCTITAQSRSDPQQSTGMSFHSCKFKASKELEPIKGTYPTFLGRPWRDYARVVYMMSYLGDHIDPKGWLEWAPASNLDTVYYGEFMNNGPRAGTTGRVKWPGVHDHMSRKEASGFTVGKFISGSSWLTQTGVAFEDGLAS
ncbi:hypothetical protein V2J09_002096 [Rumex salicifolius]